MTLYNATVETSRRGFDTDAVMDALAAFHPSLSESERGWATATITLPGESLAQATVSALAVVGQAFGAEPVAAEVMTTAEFDAREGWAAVPELLSVTQVAERLGVSRQAVLQRIESKSLPASRVGREWAVPASAVQP